MTPVLIGRWQTRLFLMLTFGLLVTIPFVIAGGINPAIVLAFVTVTGFFWDVLYTFIQKFHWDHDWPASFQFGAGVLEFIILFIAAFGLGVFGTLNLFNLFFHYWAVWLTTFLASQSIMRIIFPRWRFFGGRII